MNRFNTAKPACQVDCRAPSAVFPGVLTWSTTGSPPDPCSGMSSVRAGGGSEPLRDGLTGDGDADGR